MIKTPKGLTKNEQRYWHTLQPKCQHFTEADVTALIRLCKVLSTIAECSKIIAAEGLILTCKSGYKQPHPAVGIRHTAEQTAIKLLKEFGLTPQSRARNRFAEDKKVDELDEFLDT